MKLYIYKFTSPNAREEILEVEEKPKTYVSNTTSHIVYTKSFPKKNFNEEGIAVIRGPFNQDIIVISKTDDRQKALNVARTVLDELITSLKLEMDKLQKIKDELK